MEFADVDLIVIGAGCAGLSLGFNLAKMGNAAPRTVFLEQRSDYQNDRTWCFWGFPKTPFMELVHNRWSTVKINDSNKKSTLIHCESSPYQLLVASDFYEHTLANITQNKRLDLRMGIQLSSEPTLEGHDWLIHTNHGSFKTKAIIDTRPISINSMGNTKLWQSFVGYEITCDQPVFDPNMAYLMDFCEPNDTFVGFTYVLPFSSKSALLEFTSFGSQPYSKDDLLDQLEKTISKYVGKRHFSVTRTESGLIPMGLESKIAAKGNKIPASYARVGVTTGSARPATGYTFQRIQIWAQKCAKELQQTGLPINHPPDSFLLSIMDDIFLNVLRNNPAIGSALFMDLFSKVSHPRLIRFLSDQGSLLDHLAVIVALPPAPFLKEVLQILKQKLSR